MSVDTAFACPADNGVPCFFDDPATGLVFALPTGWAADIPTREAATAGGRPGAVRVTFFSMTDPVETVVLNPRQWVAMNGPCLEIQPGSLCSFASDSPELMRAVEILSRGIRDMGPPEDAAGANGGASSDGHDQDAGTTRAWTDYPHRCLPDDKTQPICDIRDAATGLAFLLPENWVAEVVATLGGVRADFFEVTGDARSMHLNPEGWPTPDSGCFVTRAGPLCTDIALLDDTLSQALGTLRRHMTTGETLRNCGNAPCSYQLPSQGFSGTLPGGWGVEAGRPLLDGHLSSWFYGATPAFDLKLIGLNQPGGENCRTVAPGTTLCEHSPYITAEEFGQIASTLVLPAMPEQDAGMPETIQLDPGSVAAIADILKGN